MAICFNWQFTRTWQPQLGAGWGTLANSLSAGPVRSFPKHFLQWATKSLHRLRRYMEHCSKCELIFPISESKNRHWAGETKTRAGMSAA